MLNAVVLDVDAADLQEVARDIRVTRIVGIGDYEHDLSTTVPYIGASTAHALGATGAGVRVAVIDSGIDYTHRNLGGPGTQAAYEAAWAPIPIPPAPAIPVVPAGTGYRVIDDPGTAADDGLFPSAKVVGGFDFVGETWPTPAVARIRIRIRSARLMRPHSAVTALTSPTSSAAPGAWLRACSCTRSRRAPRPRLPAAASH